MYFINIAKNQQENKCVPELAAYLYNNDQYNRVFFLLWLETCHMASHICCVSEIF